MLGFIVKTLLAITAPASAGAATEWLVPPAAYALQSAETVHNELRLKTVYVGRGETLELWTRKITTWTYGALYFRSDAFDRHARRVYEDVVATCPGIDASALRSFDWSGRRAAEYVAVCPYLPETGRPDIYMARMVAGENSFLAGAVTFRGPPSQSEIQQARLWLDGLIYCSTATPRAECRR